MRDVARLGEVMMTLDEMRAITRHIKKELPGVRSAELTIDDRGVLELEVKMQDGRIFFDGVNLERMERNGAGELVAHAFTESIHKFVRDQKRRAVA